ncbi:MAG: hypothetical protein Fur0040_08720 [Sideroxydans sp.]
MGQPDKLISQSHKQGWRNPWLLGLLAAVLAAVVINIGGIFWNITQHPANVLDAAYSVKDHDKHVAQWVNQQAQRSTLDWHATLRSPQRIPNDPEALPMLAGFMLNASPAKFELELKDAGGHLLSGAAIKVKVQWPGDAAQDFPVEFHEVGAGLYAGDIAFPHSGNWDLQINALHQGSTFVMEQRVFVVSAK